MKKFLTLALTATILMGVGSAKTEVIDTTRKALDILSISHPVVLSAEEQAFFEFMKRVDTLLNGTDLSRYDSSDSHEVVILFQKLKQMAAMVSRLDLSLDTDVKKLGQQMEIHRSEKYAQRVEELVQKYMQNVNVSSAKDFWNSLFGVKTAFASQFAYPPSFTDDMLCDLKVFGNSLQTFLGIPSLDEITGRTAVFFGMSQYPSEFVGITYLFNRLTDFSGDCESGTREVVRHDGKKDCCPKERDANLWTCCPKGTVAFGEACLTPQCAQQTKCGDWCPCGGVSGKHGCCKNGYAFRVYDAFNDYQNYDKPSAGFGDYTMETPDCCEMAGKVWSCDGGDCVCCPEGMHYSVHRGTFLGMIETSKEGKCCPIGQKWIPWSGD